MCTSHGNANRVLLMLLAPFVFFWEGAKRTIKYLGWFVGGLFVNSYTSLPLVSYPRLTRSSKLADSQIENEHLFFLKI